ncbi:glycosyltransferase [Microbacterium sp. APC 3901]|uniref:glycosyltransferase n=1 Tax=Microbacterium sp. APC 3901 TaxID=3035192 RepID=UPI0025B2F81C|nr:glycosyltransferase [Microbacterium sp. APC 3901]MDN3442783.1 glycosyltransferase [Microbacterium sp. APC 3901]
MQSPVLLPTPHVSIIIPMYNDEEWIAAAVESCMRQTLSAIEIICVDDASTDRSREIVERYQAVDPRIRLVSFDRNRSAFQARRAGIMAATAPYVLFLDGDDELAPDAAEKATAEAQKTSADLVGFGVEVVTPDGRSGGGFEKRLQPSHELLENDAILPSLFPVGVPARGQIWRYLFHVGLLRVAYAQLSPDLELYRANDLPIAYLAIAAAQRYVSLPAKLYRYNFGRGISGHRVEEASQFEFYLRAIDSIDSIAPAVREQARKRIDPDPLMDSYASARLSVIGNLLNYLINNTAEGVRADCLGLLRERVSEEDVVLAATGFCPGALALLAQSSDRIELGSRPIRSVLLTTKSLTTGGVSGVLLTQARVLLDAGYDVTIAARRPGSSADAVPYGAKFVEIGEGSLLAQVTQWGEICRRESIDLVIDHQILYSRDWPAYALIARSLGAATIGWVHNFAARPVYDLNDLTSLMTDHLGALAQLITLSPLDVAFWKLRGIRHVAYLPNPPSPMILEAPIENIVKTAPQGRPVRLLWWGRLEQHTKQVRQLLLVAAELRKLGVAFEMKIIGPGWAETEPHMLEAEARKLGLEEVSVPGPLYGEHLLSAIDAADIFVNTSVIEGYPLTILEAQARGLPVVMYDMPWLALAADNGGIVSVPQATPAAFAREVVAIVESPDRYDELSRESLAVAKRKRDFDFGQTYRQLVEGELPAAFSPEPTLDDAQRLIDLLIFFTERNAGLRAKKTAAVAAARKATAEAAATKKAAAVAAKAAARKAARIAAKAAEKSATRQAGERTQSATPTAARISRQSTSPSPSAQASTRAKTAPPVQPDPLLVGMIRPLGRVVLKVMPGLRPTAHKFNKMVRER